MQTLEGIVQLFKPSAQRACILRNSRTWQGNGRDQCLPACEREFREILQDSRLKDGTNADNEMTISVYSGGLEVGYSLDLGHEVPGFRIQDTVRHTFPNSALIEPCFCMSLLN